LAQGLKFKDYTIIICEIANVSKINRKLLKITVEKNMCIKVGNCI